MKEFIGVVESEFPPFSINMINSIRAFGYILAMVVDETIAISI